MPESATVEQTTTKTTTRPKERSKPETKKPQMWNVVLLDDDDHSYAYVIRMMMEVFHKSFEKGYQLACEVDAAGRVICETTHKERAEFKRDQVLAYGKDALIMHCAGSMSAIIEPAEGGDDDDDDSDARDER